MSQIAVIYKSQRDATANLRLNDCALTCAAMLINYIASFQCTVNALVPLSAEADNDNGEPFADVVRLLRSHAVDARGQLVRSLDELEPEIVAGRPVVLSLQHPVGGARGTVNHAVVIVGLVNGTWIAHDPYTGPFRYVSAHDLWTNATATTGGAIGNALFVASAEPMPGVTVAARPIAMGLHVRTKPSADALSAIVRSIEPSVRLDVEYASKDAVYRWWRVVRANDPAIVGGYVAGKYLTV